MTHNVTVKLGERPRSRRAVAALRLGQVDDRLVGAGVAEHPLPTVLRVRETLGRAALAAREPYAGGDRDDVDHVSRIDRSLDQVDARAPQLGIPRMA